MSIKLDAAIKSVCPIHGVSIGRKDDKTTWRIDFKDEATAEQRASAQAVFDTFDHVAAEQPTSVEKITDLERTEGQGVYVRGIREFMLGMAQIIAAQGGPDIAQTPGMQNIKRLDDKIKVLRSQI